MNNVTQQDMILGEAQSNFMEYLAEEGLIDVPEALKQPTQRYIQEEMDKLCAIASTALTETLQAQNDKLTEANKVMREGLEDMLAGRPMGWEELAKYRGNRAVETLNQADKIMEGEDDE